MKKITSNKRTRLLEAANKLVCQQGFNQTTLADIAKEADVPLGNIYYYYKAKEDIGNALIAHNAGYYQALTAAWEKSSDDPKKRILALIREVASRRQLLAQSGCPIGSLCQELRKDGGPLADKAATLLAAILSWAEQQFRLLGKGQESADLALHLISVLQGAGLLTHAFNKPSLMLRATTRLEQWVDTL